MLISGMSNKQAVIFPKKCRELFFCAVFCAIIAFILRLFIPWEVF